ncbi:ABC transporter substrate-binding protein [Cohnella rhizosphaerae]|uniref:Extracellular solute-binding protein n=1 Tax=Cohnella rhizosphaerae TaxID=1457232 RepID=A0A9X4QXY5_9BACL|nr:extracellular solute-binding protein [Cohnella rhizosphaerae]MDG0814062.1 extracellular solute-binding protein [Cohnella rhizosphaerae]
MKINWSRPTPRPARVTLLVACAAALAGCARSGANPVVPAPSAETVPVLYMTAGNPGSGSTGVIRELATEYAGTHPHFKFRIESVQNNDLSQKMQLLAASNDLPAMFSYQSGEPLLDLIRSGAVLELQGTFERLGIADRLNPVAVDLLKRMTDGMGLYALPLELNIEGFWYNKTLFARYRLDEPRTWDDMERAADVFKRAGIQPFAVAGKDKWPITRLINAYAIRKLGADAMERVYRGELRLTDPGFVEAAGAVQRMAQAGYFGQDPNTIDIGSAMRAFTQGQAAMIYTGSWAIRDLNKTVAGRIAPEAIGFFSIPLAPEGSGSLDEYPVNAGLTTSFSSEAYNEELGDFIKYAFQRYGQRSMDELGLITGFKADTTGTGVPPLTRMVQRELDGASRTALWFEARFDTHAQMTAWNGAQLLIQGSGYTPTDYMNELQAALNGRSG